LGNISSRLKLSAGGGEASILELLGPTRKPTTRRNARCGLIIASEFRLALAHGRRAFLLTTGSRVLAPPAAQAPEPGSEQTKKTRKVESKKKEEEKERTQQRLARRPSSFATILRR
jgi:hypothetical protein